MECNSHLNQTWDYRPAWPFLPAAQRPNSPRHTWQAWDYFYECYRVSSFFLLVGKQDFELTNETKKILGYNCKKAVTKVNSNTIEVWYTNDMKLKGGPSVLGQNLGLVLEVERNKNSLITASSIKKIKNTGKNPAVISYNYSNYKKNLSESNK